MSRVTVQLWSDSATQYLFESEPSWFGRIMSDRRDARGARHILPLPRSLHARTEGEMKKAVLAHLQPFGFIIRFEIIDIRTRKTLGRSRVAVG